MKLYIKTLISVIVFSLPIQCFAAISLCAETMFGKYCIVIPSSMITKTKITFTEVRSNAKSVEFISILEPTMDEVESDNIEIKKPSEILTIIKRPRIGIQIGYPKNYYWSDFGSIQYPKIGEELRTGYALYPANRGATVGTIGLSDEELYFIEDSIIVIDILKGTTKNESKIISDIYVTRKQINSELYAEVRTYFDYRSSADNIINSIKTLTK